ncbi:hypothetical protein HMPREF0758_1932 [Serratia odorifera DSM 4582]|uniref:Uncharacterized protein n=1 Tax=Serratia odorifera DSM 4582 TaxID=667129 RepID=D4E1F8_SEROD|nr:hypothetical protein HMPREF0758_1932 [Serratia odorifera DSM 4582]
MPLTSIEFGLLLAKRQPFQNGAEFYSNGCCFVKHQVKEKPDRTVRHSERHFSNYGAILRRPLIID